MGWPEVAGARDVLPAGARAAALESVSTALDWARKTLAPSRTASLDAQVLLAHLLHRSRSWLFAHGDASLGSGEQAAFALLIQRRAGGEPVAYLRGWVEWYGMELEVTPSVLIPRPETELLLERSIDVARRCGARVLADIGTGSGAIAVQLARHVPGARVYAVELEVAAIEVASRNARRHGVYERIRFLCGGLLDPLQETPDVIVANLPYLSDEMMRNLDRDVRFEPERALHGGRAGTELYERLLGQMAQRGWWRALLEIDPLQAAPLQALVAGLRPGSRCTVWPDYAGRSRVLEIEP